MLSYEFCKISKNTFFTKHLLATASISFRKIIKSVLFQGHPFTDVFKNWRHEIQKQPPKCSILKGIHKNFITLTEKHLCQSFLFNKILLKNKALLPVSRCFTVNFVKFLRTPFLRNTSVREITKNLSVSMFQAITSYIQNASQPSAKRELQAGVHVHWSL